MNDTIDLRKKKKNEIVDLLEQKGYDKLDEDNEYKYLLKMSMDSVSEENVNSLINDRDSKSTQLEQLKNKTITQMWLEELEALSEEYNKKTANENKPNGENKKVKSKKPNIKNQKVVIVDDE